MSVKRYFRFVDQAGNVCYGEVPDEPFHKGLEGIEVAVLSDGPFEGLSRTGRKAVVRNVSNSTPLHVFVMVWARK
jgi:hypothetical protein